jgi:hypothetical protein
MEAMRMFGRDGRSWVGRSRQGPGWRVAFGVIVSLTFAGSASAIPLPDQKSPVASDFTKEALDAVTGSTSFLNGPRAQSFTTAVEMLFGVDVFVLPPLFGSSTPTLELQITDSELQLIGSQTVADIVFPVSGGVVVSFDFSAPLPLGLGETYQIELSALTGQAGWKFTSDDYAGGIAIINDTPDSALDFMFQTRGMNPVPEPATASLISLGLVALACRRRR